MLGLALLAGVGGLTAGYAYSARREGAPGCLFSVPVGERWVALTIDDGPNAANTPEIMRVLREHGARATLFTIAERVAGNEALLREAVAAGHEIGNHLTRDEPSIRLAPAQFEAALDEAQLTLAPYGAVRWFRPGSGWYNRRMVKAAARRGLRCALGSIYPFDAQIPSVRFASWYVLRTVRPGAVIVLHDGPVRGRRTRDVLRRVLPQLARRGYRVTTLSGLAAAGSGDPRAAPPSNHQGAR